MAACDEFARGRHNVVMCKTMLILLVQLGSDPVQLASFPDSLQVLTVDPPVS